MTKLAIVMARGVEGCGVTKCVKEIVNVLPKSDVFGAIDRKFSRAWAHDFDYVPFKAADWTSCSTVLEKISTGGYDAVLVCSLPSYENKNTGGVIKSDDLAAGDNFIRFLDEIKLRKGMCHFDHSIKALHSNYKLGEMVRRMDVAMAHSREGALARWMRKEKLSTPFHEMVLGFDFEAHRKKYWKPIEEQHDFEVRWIGRTARWKGVQLMLDFHEAELRKLQYRTILEGLEASINYVIALYHDEHVKQKPRDVINKFRSWKGMPKDNDVRHGEEEYGGPAYCYPPYKNTECMDRLSKSAFGSDLYHLKPEHYGNNIENCHAEVIASGTVPIFHRHFGENVHHRETGDPCYGHARSGTIWLGSDEWTMKNAAEIMLNLSLDQVLRDEWREMSFEFWKSHADSKFAVDEIVKNLLQSEPNGVLDIEQLF